MKRGYPGLLFIRLLLLTGTVASLYFVPWPMVRAWLKPLPDTVQAQVEATRATGFEGVVLAIHRRGAAPELYTAGHMDRDARTPCCLPDALFKIASAGKLYVALSVAKLATEGRLPLDSSLAHFLPGLGGQIENADAITVRHLVGHRSGIPNFTDAEGFWLDAGRSDDDKLALVLGQPADFAPDAGHAYSNTNYLLLRRILDGVLGHAHWRFIETRILGPLGLKETYASIHDVDIDRVIGGYYEGVAHDLKREDVGSMLATAAELSSFVWALHDGSAFASAAERRLYRELYVSNHTGLIPGYQTTVRYEADLDAVVVQFTNTVDFNGYSWSLAELGLKRAVEIAGR